MAFRAPRVLIAAALLSAAGVSAARAQGSALPADAAENGTGAAIRVYLATYGQGAAVWELFGHNALWVQDGGTGETRSYNWGSFSFDEPGFVRKLIRGSMRYWLAVDDAGREVAGYQYRDRSITVQELELTPAQKLELKRFVEWNALPENAYYEYHYYRDNCSTRVRDALDRVLGGQLARQLQAIHTRETFRSHSLRLAARAPFTYTGMELGLADSADHPLSAWEEAFIPMELMRRLRAVQVTDSAGAKRPLVRNEIPLFVSTRPAPYAAAPNRVPAYLATGILIGLLFPLLARLAVLFERRRGPTAAGARAARWTLALAAGAWSLVAGFFGTLVLLLWSATGHTFTYGNENLFQVNPLPLLLAVLVPVAVLTRGRALRAARQLAVLVAGISLLGLLLKVLPGFDQMNYDILALLIPTHFGMVAAVQLLWCGRADRALSPAVDRRAGRAPAQGARPQA